MRLFDTHCHLADPAFEADLTDVMVRMRDQGVCSANIVADPCEEVPNQERVFALAESDAGFVASIGVHPHNACRYDSAAEDVLLSYINHPKFALLGEIGLDYHYDFSPREVQREVFARQLDLAWEKKLSVQLHIREAHGDCIDMLRARRSCLPEGIMHCFTGSWESAKIYLDMGFYISLSGALTFKNAPKLREVAEKLPEECMLIETDCPYMSPVPLRGRRNEPAFLAHTLARFAEIRACSPDALAEQIYGNSLHALRLEQ